MLEQATNKGKLRLLALSLGWSVSVLVRIRSCICMCSPRCSGYSWWPVGEEGLRDLGLKVTVSVCWEGHVSPLVNSCCDVTQDCAARAAYRRRGRPSWGQRRCWGSVSEQCSGLCNQTHPHMPTHAALLVGPTATCCCHAHHPNHV